MLKLLSYWAIYVVLIESILRQPFLSLARDANTYDANTYDANTYDAVPD
jgi:hypothetical protein